MFHLKVLLTQFLNILQALGSIVSMKYFHCLIKITQIKNQNKMKALKTVNIILFLLQSMHYRLLQHTKMVVLKFNLMNIKSLIRLFDLS